MKQTLLNAFYIAFTGSVLGSFLYSALFVGVAHLTH